MSFVESLALVGTAATILGVFLTVYGIINNKTLKKESVLTREIIKNESALTREAIQQGTEAISKMIQETIKYLADLIVAEGGKIRTGK